MYNKAHALFLYILLITYRMGKLAQLENKKNFCFTTMTQKFSN